MVTIEVATNGYVVRGSGAKGLESLLAIARHYEEASHYMTHFVHRESDQEWEIPPYLGDARKIA